MLKCSLLKSFFGPFLLQKDGLVAAKHLKKTAAAVSTEVPVLEASPTHPVAASLPGQERPLPLRPGRMDWISVCCCLVILLLDFQTPQVEKHQHFQMECYSHLSERPQSRGLSREFGASTGRVVAICCAQNRPTGGFVGKLWKILSVRQKANDG